MLHRRALGGAALALALSLCASSASAQVDGEHWTPGASCPSGAVAGHAVMPDWDTFFECNGSGNWQRGPYFFGATSDTCDSNHAGMVQWTGSAFQGCNGSTWGQIDSSTSVALSSLLAATTTNGFDNANWAQIWKWGTLSTQTALTLTTSSMTGGTLLSLQDTAAAATSTGYVLSVTDATTGTGYGIYSVMTSAANTGYAGYFANSGTNNSYGIYASIAGAANNGVAGYFTSNTSYAQTLQVVNTNTGGGIGIYASGNTGVDGNGGSGGGIGIYGSNANSGSYGIKGLVSADNSYAVYGTSSDAHTSYGIYGSVTGAANTGYAGFFTNTATSGVGYGVYASNGSASGYGGYFTNTSTGWALYASGNANITGSAQVGSTAASCSGSNAGAVQYTSGTLEACNGTSWIPIDGGMHFISTQTASNSTSLQFTNMPAYNTLFLNCTSLLSSNLNAVYLYQIGEGATPTWETTGNYSGAYVFVNNSTSSFASATDLTDGMGIGAAPMKSSTTKPSGIQLYINSIASSSLMKWSTWTRTDNNTGGQLETTGYSWWTSDTNAVTALQVTTTNSAGATIKSGQCSLYGMN